jgi:hypothetical protein
MRLQVNPIYGWGWYKTEGEALEVPAQFVLDAAVETPVDSRKSFTTALLGHLSDDSSHPLAGLWILLSPRGGGAYNPRAFVEKPEIQFYSGGDAAQPCITGFAYVAESGTDR